MSWHFVFVFCNVDHVDCIGCMSDSRLPLLIRTFVLVLLLPKLGCFQIRYQELVVSPSDTQC